MGISKTVSAVTPFERVPAIPAAFDWSACHVLVLGCGESGLASIRWLLRQNARISVLDTRASPPGLERLQALDGQRQLSLHLGVASPFDPSWCEGIDLVIPSPGLSPHPEHASPAYALLSAAKAQGIKVVGELDLFQWAIHHATHASSQRDAAPDLALPLEHPKILAITGTNGKTTTTQMTVALLRRAGFDAQEAGNISPSLLDAVMAREDESRFPEVWVLELSSFQLAYAQHFHPTAAVCLNISEDHLDWHRDFEDYIAAKGRIYGIGIDPAQSDVQCIGYRQDARVMSLMKSQRHVCTFGTEPPSRPGDFGLQEEGISWMVLGDAHDQTQLHRLMPADALRVRGRHNAMNALAALALCRAVTPALAPLLHGLREFRGSAHRMQWIAHLQGLEFIDDSKGTNVGATAAALSGLTLPVILIAGGDGKGQDFSPLLAAMRGSTKAVVTIGRDGPAIAQIAQQAGLPTMAAQDMGQAVNQAVAFARQLGLGHAAVLLSPACASFDMYANYLERAKHFCEAVQEMAAAQGVSC
ncbi:MAG: UDP-N-acetylmuramoyl-L-alanine--D-glutamate ligase [Betaproteobacteria bacterium]|jgi:UDP-N-acetylmuramoylalanine--D-glutamate ligase|nr:UDP-N-acetylmuramoyl-L-alanine--D-glutamate ligase [Betaproteobacteria bacterium]